MNEDKSDHLPLREEHDIFIPSVDVCSNCGDCYCDGTACILAIDPDDEAQHEALNEVQDRIRFGRAWQAMVRLVEAGVDLPTALAAADEALVDAGHRSQLTEHNTSSAAVAS